VVKKVARHDLIAFQHAWLRPDNAQIFVVRDRPLAEIALLLEPSFGAWKPEGPKGVKNFATATPSARSRIVLIDRPGWPQSLILGDSLLPVNGKDELITLLAAIDILGAISCRASTWTCARPRGGLTVSTRRSIALRKPFPS
jgi:predicted Zn-dependent peptidase